MFAKISTLPPGTRIRILRMPPMKDDEEGTVYEAFKGTVGTVENWGRLRLDAAIPFVQGRWGSRFYISEEFEFERLDDPDGNY